MADRHCHREEEALADTHCHREEEALADTHCHREEEALADDVAIPFMQGSQPGGLPRRSLRELLAMTVFGCVSSSQ